MIPLLLEYEQIIHVKSENDLNKNTIRFALYDAQRTRRYAKFYSGRYYISVSFNRDTTIQISSNYRQNAKFNKELYNMEHRKYSINSMTYFIWYWMNKIRKL